MMRRRGILVLFLAISLGLFLGSAAKEYPLPLLLFVDSTPEGLKVSFRTQDMGLCQKLKEIEKKIDPDKKPDLVFTADQLTDELYRLLNIPFAVITCPGGIPLQQREYDQFIQICHRLAENGVPVIHVPFEISHEMDEMEREDIAAWLDKPVNWTQAYSGLPVEEEAIEGIFGEVDVEATKGDIEKINSALGAQICDTFPSPRSTEGIDILMILAHAELIKTEEDKLTIVWRFPRQDVRPDDLAARLEGIEVVVFVSCMPLLNLEPFGPMEGKFVVTLPFGKVPKLPEFVPFAQRLAELRGQGLTMGKLLLELQKLGLSVIYVPVSAKKDVGFLGLAFLITAPLWERRKRGWLLSLIAVASLALASPGLATNVLIWSKYTTYTERSNLLTILEDVAWVDFTNTADPDELSWQLEEVDVLLLPEQTRAPDRFVLQDFGSEIAWVLYDFLQWGGRIVALEVDQGGIEVLAGAGLTTASSLVGEDATGDRIFWTHWEPLFAEVPKEFAAPRFATTFGEVDPDAEILMVDRNLEGPLMFRLHREGGEILCLGLDFWSYTPITAQLLKNAVSPRRGWPKDFQAQVLSPNELVSRLFSAGERTETEREQYSFFLGEDVELLGISMRTDGKAALYIRYLTPVAFQGQEVKADFSFYTAGGEASCIFPADLLFTGTYLVGLENQDDVPQTISLVIAPFPDIRGPGTFEGVVEPVWVSPLREFLKTLQGQLGLTQHKVELSEGGCLRIKLEGEGEIALHLRRGSPVEVEGGELACDLSAAAPNGALFLTISGDLLPGTWFIAIEATEPPQKYRLEVEVE